MADQTIEFISVSGQTIDSVKIFPDKSDAQTDDQPATEQPNRKGVYQATFVDAPAGVYQVIASVSGDTVATWKVTLTLSTFTFYGAEYPFVAPGQTF